MAILDEQFAIVDVETTGTRAAHDRITEIAILRVAGGDVEQRYSTLVNPEAHIPEFIQHLTGITTDMVADAPTFDEISETVLTLLDGCALVAHNARFDYGFLRNAFSRVGVRYRAPLLCTVKLSRALYPEQRRHNLDSLIHRHGLSCEQRHRAMGDALVLHQFMRRVAADHPSENVDQVLRRLLRRPALPPGLDESQLDALPETSGVYIFNDQRGNCLYVGKSTNIRQRVMSHFTSDRQSTKEMDIARQVTDIEAIRTAGELGALLKEVELVRTLSPAYNRQLRGYDQAWSICWSPLTEPIAAPRVIPVTRLNRTSGDEYFGLFRNESRARRTLRKLAADRELCFRVLGLEAGKGACKALQVGKCSGVCVGHESEVEHKIRIMQALLPQKIQPWPFPGAVGLRETAAECELHAVHVFDDWCHLDTLDANATTLPEGFGDGRLDVDVYRILHRYLNKHSARLEVIDMGETVVRAAR